MLSNAYFLAKFRFDTAENEPAKNLQNFVRFANFADPNPLTLTAPATAAAARPPREPRPLLLRPGLAHAPPRPLRPVRYAGIFRKCIFRKFCKFLAGSFSAVSKRNFARKYAFDSIFQALQDLHPFAPLQSQNFRKKSV